MKINSITTLIDNSLKTLYRFPFTLSIAIIGTLFSIVIIEAEIDYDDSHSIYNLVHVCVVGLTLMLSVASMSERYELSGAKALLSKLGVLLLMTAYFFYLPQEYSEIHIVRSILLLIAFHLLVSFAPFIVKGTLKGFWQYNKILFLNIMTAALYTIVLYGGISLAITAVVHLFDIDIDGKIYAELWFFLAGIFNTWFFLSNFPKKYKSLEFTEEYPVGLKIFTKYVLIPLVSLYLIILYSYTLKIILQWELPVGWVSYMILSFSIAGIFALLLVYPLQDSDNAKWIKIYSRWYYRALLPLIVLLFFAVGRRVAEYGITENRYFVIVLALWLAGTSIYLLINKLKNIKIIPVSLAIVAFLASFGPWGAFNVSKHSQLNRLKTHLEKYDAFVDGKIQKITTDTINFDDKKEINEIVRYLYNTHGYKSMKHLFTQDLDSLATDTSKTHHSSSDIVELIGINYVERWQNKKEVNHFNYYSNLTHKTVNIKDYDYFLFYKIYPYNDSALVINDYELNDSTKIHVKYMPESKEFCITKNKNTELISYNFYDYFREVADRYKKNQPLDSIKLNYELSNNLIDLKLLFTSINGNENDNMLNINSLEANILLRLKKE